MWNIHGVPGIGKSRLAAELSRMATSSGMQKVAACHLDFEVPRLRVIEDALYYIRQHLPYRCNTFDFAFARYWTMLGRSLSALDHRHRVKGGSLLLDIAEYAKTAGAALTEAGGFLPGVGLLAKLGGAAARRLRRWRAKHKDLLDHMERLELVELRDRLAHYLGVDISDAAESGRVTILVFDSFERLTDVAEAREVRGSHRGDQWVRDLLASTQRMAAVILSRRRLTWPEHPSEAWGESFVPWLLDRLESRDVEDFLRNVPIEDEGMRAHIARISNGVPFLIDLCLDAWEHIVSGGGEPISGDIGIDSNQIVERFLDGRSLEERATIKAIAFPEVFDENVFQFMVREVGTSYPANEFESFARLSFVRRLEGSDLYHLHHTMRAALLSTLTLGERRRVTQALVEYCRSSSTVHGSDACLVGMTLGFQLLSERPEIAPWLYGTTRDLVGAGHWPEVDRVLSEFEGRLSNEARSVTSLIRSLVLRRWGRIDEALDAFAEGQPARVAPHERFVAFHHANLLRIGGSYGEAGRIYQQIADGDHHDNKTRLLAGKQLADLLMLRGRFSRSLEVLEGTLRKSLEPTQTAELLRQQGHVYRWNFLADEARESYEAALAIAEERSLHSLTGRLETNMLELHALSGTDAGPLADRALQTNETLGATIELGKVHCARAILCVTQGGDLAKARLELALSLKCFRSSKYRAGVAFSLIAHVLLDIAEGGLRSNIVLRRLISLTNALGVYRFLARGLFDAIARQGTMRPEGRVYWIRRSHAQASWSALVAAARGRVRDGQGWRSA